MLYFHEVGAVGLALPKLRFVNLAFELRYHPKYQYQTNLSCAVALLAKFI